MRLWTLHPKYLDARGLVALWREALLLRFRQSPAPLKSIAAYLRAVHAEASRRGYCFDAGKIGASGRVKPIAASRGQRDYEWARLRAKLRTRAPTWLAGLGKVARPSVHPLFRMVPGPVADWEVVPPRQPLRRQRAKATRR